MNLIKKIGKEVLSTTTGINLGSSSGGAIETWYVTAIRAEGIKDKDRFTKSDPYLVVSIGSKSFRTRTVKNDLSPQWNETFTFKIPKGKSKDIHLKLKDDDYGIDDTIGTAVVSAADLPMYSGEEKSIQIAVKKSEEIHGIVYLRVKKFVEGEQSYSSQQSTNQYSTQYQQQQQQPSYQNYQQQQQQPSYQNYQQQQQPSYQNYQQQQQQPQHHSSYQNYQQNQQVPYGQPPQYQQQQQQNYPPAGYSSMPPQQSSYSTGYQQQQRNQYPYQQYNQGYNQGYQR